MSVQQKPLVKGQWFALSWSEVMQQYENLVKFASKSVLETLRGQGVNVDSMISAEDLYQEGITCLWICWSKYGIKEMEEFGKIFKKSLFRVLKRKAAASYVALNLEDVMPDVSYLFDVVEDVYIREGIKQLKDCLEAPLPKVILQELISPSPRTLWEVWADKERKKMLKGQGKRVNIPNTNEIKIKHIRTALGVTPKQMDLALLEMRKMAKTVYNTFYFEECSCRIAFEASGYSMGTCVGCDGSCYEQCKYQAEYNGLEVNDKKHKVK